MFPLNLFLLLFAVFINFVSPQPNPPDCNFAQSYNLESLFFSTELQERFLMDASYWEGKFVRDQIGINIAGGLTYDGTVIDYDSGLPRANGLHKFSAASKEAIHLSMLALVLDGNQFATNFFFSSIQDLGPGSVYNFVLEQLTRKIAAYRNFTARYPGFGGYIPWYGVDDSGMMTTLWDWESRVPSLDNGEMIWGLIAVAQTLKEKREPLAKEYEDYIELLAKNGLMMFYKSDGNRTNLITVAMIANRTAEPSPDNYSPPDDCTPTNPCFLDDPYEGELFTLFLYLYGNWTDYGGDEARDQMWIDKRGKLQPANFTSSMGKITVERGWWFSSHEKWKYLELPYFDVPANERVFLNGERARTHFSNKNGYPGLFAAVTNYSVPGTPDTYNPDYIGGLGIQEIAFERVAANDIVTPYGAIPLLVHPETRRYGIAWYAAMLQGNRMQGPQGSTEAIKTSGEFISPMNTWDSKITSVVAFCGGILGITRRYLRQTGKYSEFRYIINREWTLAFGDDPLIGSEFDFMTPSTRLPYNGTTLTGCNRTSTTTDMTDTSPVALSTIPSVVMPSSSATTPTTASSTTTKTASSAATTTASSAATTTATSITENATSSTPTSLASSILAANATSTSTATISITQTTSGVSRDSIVSIVFIAVFFVVISV